MWAKGANKNLRQMYGEEGFATLLEILTSDLAWSLVLEHIYKFHTQIKLQRSCAPLEHKSVSNLNIFDVQTQNDMHYKG